MSMGKIVCIGFLSLFTFIGGAGLIKKNKKKKEYLLTQKEAMSEESVEAPIVLTEATEKETQLKPIEDVVSEEEMDQVWRLFTTSKQKLPIVETIRYKVRVPWCEGRPAWVSDYASHYSTSRHFIARSLNKKRDYETQKISLGDQFNVLKKEVSFYLVIDLSRCKMWFYAIDEVSKERYLLKTYKVGVGRFDQKADSGVLTPKGTFVLGNKVAVYKPGIEGYFQDNLVEMVRIFGTRWIPFSEKVSGEGESPRGYGLHGAPWVYDLKTKSYREDLSTIGGYSSDGCVRLTQEDIEELFCIVITKPTVVQVVSDFQEATLPGKLVEK